MSSMRCSSSPWQDHINETVLFIFKLAEVPGAARDRMVLKKQVYSKNLCFPSQIHTKNSLNAAIF